MIFSVWNNAARRYDYYEGPGTPTIHAGAPPRRESNALGATPEQAAWRLPSGSTRVGTGEMPRGRIASLGDSDGISIDLKQSFIYGVVGYLLWRALR